MVVGEVFLAAFIQVLFEKLAGELLNFARREPIRNLLKKLSKMLEGIEAVLADAEDKQITAERGIKQWLQDLEEFAYDLDDIMDELATDALRRKVMEEPRASTSKVRALIPTCCTSFNPRSLVSYSEMRSKLDSMNARLGDIDERRRVLGLQERAARAPAKAPQRPPATSLIQEPCVYGRGEDQKKIIDLLLSDHQSGNSKVGVVPIVGMGGIGKTTLARMVYNDEMVVKHFDIKAWICVSEEFDIEGVTKAILKSVTKGNCDFKSLDDVQVELKQALAGKKFLIVLDDVWNEKYSDWISLKAPFNDGSQGSKVMVTTRHKEVARVMGAVSFHDLKPLSEDDCWLVFAQNAFENTGIEESSNLDSIGGKIVEKCGGLPLAARTLGGLLRGKLREDEWKNVLNSKIWELSNSDILPALRLSYHHLPSHLKKCFAYCAILPKDYEFEQEELVLLWMAEGFIQQPNEEKQMEDLGCEYFRELLSRSFFQPSSSNESSMFVMHDLINDLAQFVAGENCFRLEDNGQYKNISKARHSSYSRGRYDGIKKFEAFREAKNMRTFLPCGSRSEYALSYLTNKVPLDVLPNLRRLRVLSLRRYKIGELPSSIGDLNHVRYLDLSYALIVRLSESIGTLYNLQTMILRFCQHLNMLPTNTENLINLRHLDVTGADSLREMPPNIGKLTSLQTLSNFIVSKDNGSMIRELGSLINLRKELCISGLENVVDAKDALGAKLNEKPGLKRLSIKWNSNSDDSRNEGVELDVIEKLQPHKNLEELSINGFHGLRLPTWVGDPLFSKIVCLKLKNCEKCTRLPPLGQLPSLARLYIKGMKAVENVGREFYGRGSSNPFPKLEILSFKDMPEWKDWSHFEVSEEVQAFSHLSELSIRKCPKLLRKLPSNLRRLTNLKIEECPLLVVEWLPSPTVPQDWNSLHFASLTSLRLSNVSIPSTFRNTEVDDDAVLENAVCSHLSSLTTMIVENIQELTCLPRWFFQGLTGLQELTISGCKELTTLWKNEVRLHHRLPALRRLKIRRCHQLISLLEEEEEWQQHHRHDGLPYIMMLEYLEIEYCEKLEKLPRRLHTLKSLQQLKIERCSALQCLPELVMLNILEVRSCSSLTYLFSRGGLPPTLKELYISDCGKLESLQTEDEMKINCPSLESIGIYGCENLKSLPDVMQSNDLRNLSRLNVIGCGNLESIPEGWFHTTNLRHLFIFKCKKLKALPHHAYNNIIIKNLASLIVDSCPVTAGIASYILKEGSSFTNLTELRIDTIDFGKPPSEWGLNRLSSLRELCLGDYCWVSFPEDGLFFPTSLVKLQIWGSPKLEKLSYKDFQNLTSLERLDIYNCPMLTSISELGLPPSLEELIIDNCPMLTSISELGLPPSLEELYINYCPNLASLPEQGLPPSLLELRISGCPILKQRCEKERGQYWSFISHIPCVEIDERFIYEPSR